MALKIVDYFPPTIEEGDDHPSLRLNVITGKDRISGKPDIHMSAVVFYSQPIIDVILPLLKLLGIPERK